MRIRFGLLALLISLALPQPALAKWLRADTANFIIYSDGNEKSLRSFAEKVERLDATLRSRMNTRREPEANRLTIYMVERAEDAARYSSGDASSSIAGFYMPHAEGTFAVSNREPDQGRTSLSGETVLFHEYAHHFMLRYAPGTYPGWFVEGFAEFYSTVDFTKTGQAEIGRIAGHRAYGLLEMPRIPTQRLLTEHPNVFRREGESDVFYGRSWLLTHMLYSDPAREGQLTKYIAAIGNGVANEEAAKQAFGDFNQVDKDLARYLSKPMTYRTTADPIAFVGTITIAPLTEAQSLLIPLRLFRLGANGETERLTKMRKLFDAKAAVLSGDANYWYERAALEWNIGRDDRDKAAMKDALDRALAINPDHVHANVLLGESLGASLADNGESSAVAWRPVRRAIAKANQLAPNDPWPQFAWYNSFVLQGVAPTENARTGLAQAFTLAPENTDVRIVYAFDLANAGQFDDAIKLAKTVVFDPHGDGSGKAILDQLDRMKRRAAGEVIEEAEEEESDPAKSGKADKPAR